MGAYYESIHLTDITESKVFVAIREIATTENPILVSPLTEGWFSVYFKGSGTDRSISETLAEKLGCPVLQLIVHDSDVFYYQFYQGGKLVDQYCSCPDYFGEVSHEIRESQRGDAHKLAILLKAPKDVAKLETLLIQMRSNPLFSSNYLGQFAQLLGLVSPWTSFEYLAEGPSEDMEALSLFPDEIRRKSLSELEQARKAISAKLIRQFENNYTHKPVEVLKEAVSQSLQKEVKRIFNASPNVDEYCAEDIAKRMLLTLVHRQKIAQDLRNRGINLGNDFESVHLKETDEPKVFEISRQIAQKGSQLRVSPSHNGWFSVYPESHYLEEIVSETFAKKLGCPVLHLFVCNSEVLYCIHYQSKKTVAQYCSNPDYFGQISPESKDHLQGSAREFAALLNRPEDADALQALFNRMQVESLIESDCLDKFLELFGLSLPWTSFEYMTDNLHDPIEVIEDFVCFTGVRHQTREAFHVSLVREFEKSQRDGPTIALIEAVRHGLKNEVNRILNSGVNVNNSNKDGFTPLMMSALTGKIAIAKDLLKRGADPNAKEANGYTPVRLALMGDPKEAKACQMLQLLIKAGADPSIPSCEGETPLEFAISIFSEDVLRLLRRN